MGFFKLPLAFNSPFNGRLIFSLTQLPFPLIQARFYTQEIKGRPEYLCKLHITKFRDPE